MKRFLFCLLAVGMGPSWGGVDHIFSTGFEPRFTVGGTITGLTALGETINITLNGEPQTEAMKDGPFVLNDPVEAGQAYWVGIDNTNCTVMNESGLMPYQNVTDVAIDCPLGFTTVYDIKQGFVTGDVALQNMLVTACSTIGYYVQTISGDPDFVGTDFSGIFVFDQTVDCNSLQVGDRVDINPATVTDFFGEIQLHNPIHAIQSSGNPMPLPVITTPAALNTMDAHPLNAVFVEVQNVTVTAETNQFGEFEVDMELLVDDRIHLPSPPPTLDEPFDFIRGPMAYNFSRNKIIPRGDFDLGRQAQLVINEVDYNQPGVDSDEYIEIHNVGGGDADLADIALLLVDGNSNTVYSTIDLTTGGSTLPGGGYLVAGSADVLSGIDPPSANLLHILMPNAFIQNGGSNPDGMALVNTADESILDVLSYEGSITAADLGFANPVSLVEGTATTAVDIDESALSRIPNGQDSDDADSDWQLSTLLTPGAANQVVQPAINLVINELDYDQPGTDNAEFVEIYNPTISAIDLNSIDLVFVNGNNNTEYGRIPLTGTLDPGAFAVIGEAGISVPVGTLFIDLDTVSIQNGSPDAVALINNTNNTLVDALSYEGAITAAIITGIVDPVNLVAGNPTGAMDSNAQVGSIIRFPDGSDTDDDATDFVFSANPTPGESNTP